MTPKKENLPDGVQADSFTQRNIIPFEASEEMVGKLFKQHYKKLIASKYISGSKLILPCKGFRQCKMEVQCESTLSLVEHL